MADNISSFIIAFDGKAGDLASVLAALKKQVRSDVTELQALTDKLELFKNIQQQAIQARNAFNALKPGLDAVRAAVEGVKNAGGTIGADLANQLKTAESASARAERSFNTQFTTFKKLRDELKVGGVDVRNLANEEVRLAEALAKANAAAALQSGKDLLNFKSIGDIKPQLDALNTAFARIRDSGTASFAEISAAQARLMQRTAALKAEVSGLGAVFNDLRFRLLAITAVTAGVTAGIFTAARNFRTFAQEMAAVESIAETSHAEIDKLANGVRQLALRMGVDAVVSAKALYEIISSGIPTQNALTVLEESSKAAIAGITDVATASRIGVAVINGFGLEVTQLGGVFDVLFKTVQDGISTFPELAAHFGTVVPAARAAGVSLQELGAAFVVLTRAGIDTPEAATAINRAIIDLSAPTPEAASKIQFLNIQLGSFIDVIRQLSDRKLNLSAIREIVPDIRGARAVLALTQSFKLLQDELTEMNSAAGATQRAYQILANTPQQQVKKFDAAVKDLSFSLGQFVTGNSEIVNSLASLVNSFNSLGATTKTTILGVLATVAGLGTFAILLRSILVPLNLLGEALVTAATGAGLLSQGVTVASLAWGAFGAAVAGVIGLSIGNWAFDSSEAIRKYGNTIALTTASFVNWVDFVSVRLNPAFASNKRVVDAATAAYQRNNQAIKELSHENDSGITENFRKLSVALAETTKQFNTVRDAALTANRTLGDEIKRLKSDVESQITAQQQLIDTFQARLQANINNLQQQTTAVTDIATKQIALINNQAATVIAGLELINTKEIENVRTTIDAQATAADERLKVIKKFGADALTAFNAEAKARLDLAKAQGGDLRNVEQGIAADRVKVLESIVGATKEHLDQLYALNIGYQEKLRTLDDERKDLTIALEDKIRGARRGTFDEYRQFSDKQSEIDEKLSRARAALLAGNLVDAEKFAKAAFSLSDDIAKGLTIDGNVIVTAQQGAIRATGDWTRATEILLEVNKKRAEAEQTGAEKTKESIGAATEQLKTYTAQLKEATEASLKGIEVKINFSEAGVPAAIAGLQAAIDKQAALVEVKIHLVLAEVETNRIQKELEDGTTINIKARTDNIRAELDKISQSKEITLDTTKALASITVVTNEAGKLEALQAKIKDIVDATKQLEQDTKSQHTVNSNVSDVQARIDALKVDTSSTHTIRVVEQRAGGGLVTARRTPVTRSGFAMGGRVFAGRKVPGAGNRDTFPATLEGGGYVIRKSASQYYGDSLLSRLGSGRARFASGGLVGRSPRDRTRFAAGGTVTKDEVRRYAESKWGFDPFAPVFDAKGDVIPSKAFADPGNIFGRVDKNGNAPVQDPGTPFKSGQSFQDKFEQRVISLDARPIPDALITATNVLEYAREMMNNVGQNNPLLGTLGRDMLQNITGIERNPKDAKLLKLLLQEAETIGSNPYLFAMWGKTAGSPAAAQVQPEWFLDWLQDRGFVDSAGAITGAAAKSSGNSGGGGSVPVGTPAIPGTGPGFLLKQNPLSRLIRTFGVDVADRIFHPRGSLGPSDVNNFALRFFQGAIPGAGDPLLRLILDKNKPKFFAGGGSPAASDTVEALLTPGEWVMKAQAVRTYGEGLMSAINNITIPKHVLERMVSPAPPRRGFAEGGSVSQSVGPVPLITSHGGGAGNAYTVNIQASANAILSPDNVRRLVVPVFDEMERRKGKS